MIVYGIKANRDYSTTTFLATKELAEQYIKDFIIRKDDFFVREIEVLESL